MIRFDETTVSTRLGRLRVRSAGTGPVVVLWHGMFIDGTTWDDVASRLVDTRRVVIVDGPGHGASEPLRRRSSIEECVDVAADLLGGLAIEEPVDWVGNAWGGHVGLGAAMRGVPWLRSLVAIGSPTIPVDDALRPRVGLLLPLLTVAGMRGPVRRAILDVQLTDASRSDPHILDRVDAALARPSGRSMRRAVRSFILDRVDVTPGLERITIPALFVATDDRGEWSPEDVAAAARRVRTARTATVRGSRILAPLERPAATADEILRFWDAVGLDRRGQANAGATDSPTART